MAEQKQPLILVIDDSEDSRELLNDILEDTYRIITAQNGIEGLAKAIRLRPDLIISDISMPRLDGLSMVRKIKEFENVREIPVILLTAFHDDEIKIDGFISGIDGYIEKPFEPRELRARVETILTKHASNERLRKRSREVEQQLETSRLIQNQILPSHIPDVPGYSLYSRYHFAEKIGGDLYNFRLHDTLFDIFIADVSGHGIPAALIAGMVHVAFDLYSRESRGLVDLMEYLDQIIYERTGQNYFVTAFFGRIDLKTDKFTYVNAGHVSPAILKPCQNSRIIELKSKGTPLGLFEKEYKKEALRYQADEVQLEKGDRILLFTDGIIEHANPGDELFGLPRLYDLLEKRVSQPPGVFAETIFDSVKVFAGQAETLDDMTLIVVDKVK